MCVGACVSACTHGAGVLLLVSNYKVLALIPGMLMQDLWWMKQHWDRFCSEYFSFPLSVSFHQHSIFIPSSMLCNHCNWQCQIHILIFAWLKNWDNSCFLCCMIRILWKWKLCHCRLFRNWYSSTFTSDFAKGIFISEEWLQHCHWWSEVGRDCTWSMPAYLFKERYTACYCDKFVNHSFYLLSELYFYFN
jgi:hypothetical protein